MNTIHKSHSKNDLIDIINHLNLPIIFSHQDNKKDIQDKFKNLLSEKFEIKDNYYNIKNKDGLKKYI